MIQDRGGGLEGECIRLFLGVLADVYLLDLVGKSNIVSSGQLGYIMAGNNIP